MGAIKEWWGRRPTWQKVAMVAFGAILVIGPFVDRDDDDRDGAAVATATTATPVDAPTTTASETTTTSTTTTTTTTTTTLPAFSERIEISGRGDDVVDVEIPDDAAAIVTFTHQGSSNFAVWSHHRTGGSDLLVNTIGGYSGTRPLNFEVGEEVVFFEVTADGGWTVLIEPLSHAPSVSASGEYAGTGDAVIIDPFAANSSTRVTFSHNGSSNFAVWGWGNRRDLLVNTIGDYDGTVLATAGTVVYDIKADGAWTVDIDR